MKVICLIISHLLAFYLGWHCYDWVLHYIHEKYDFDELAKRLDEYNYVNEKENENR